MTEHDLSPACPKPALSIVMPAYNAERTIETAIDSILKQSYEDFELIICNDGSTDQTLTLIESFNDPRIIIIDNKINCGEGPTRDAAIRAARADWIAVIDADDAWHSERAKKLMSIAEKNPNSIIFDDLLLCHDKTGQMIPWKPLRGATKNQDKDKTHKVAFSEFIVQKSLLIKPFFEKRTIKEHSICHSSKKFGADTEFFLELIRCGKELIYIPQPLYYYRIMTNSMSSNTRRYPLMRSILESFLETASLHDDDKIALQKKLESIKRAESYAPFLEALKSRHYLSAISIILKRPSIILEFISRLPETIPYRLHQKWKGAKGR